MTARPGDRIASLVLRWCDLYTRGLPASVAADRHDELESDLHDHRVASLAEPRSTVRRDIAVRALLGVPADLSWRTHQRRAMRSAPHPEVAMPARAPLDAWTRIAYGLGAVVTAWTAAIGIGMLVDARNAAPGSYDFTARIGIGSMGLLMLVLAVHGMLGLRTRPVRAGVELGVAAVAMTMWMTWAGIVVGIGVSCLAFFTVFALRMRRAQRSPVTA